MSGVTIKEGMDKAARDLKLIRQELDALRFVGLDQNPKAIRDRLYSVTFNVESLAKRIG